MALVEMSVVEQRYWVVVAVLAGMSVVEVAVPFRVADHGAPRPAPRPDRTSLPTPRALGLHPVGAFGVDGVGPLGIGGRVFLADGTVWVRRRTATP
jgi:hypothetical protein